MKRPHRLGAHAYGSLDEEARTKAFEELDAYIKDRRLLAQSYRSDAEAALVAVVQAKAEVDAVTGVALNSDTLRWVLARRDKAVPELNNAVYRLTTTEGEVESYSQYLSLYVEWEEDMSGGMQ